MLKKESFMQKNSSVSFHILSFFSRWHKVEGFGEKATMCDMGEDWSRIVILCVTSFLNDSTTDFPCSFQN